MFLRLTTLLAALFPLICLAQTEHLTVRSRSDQFIVYGPQSPRSLRGANPLVEMAPSGQGHFFKLRSNPFPSTSKTWMHLDPSLVAVSCERIKEALLRELNEKDTKDRRIYIQLNSRIRQNQTSIVADRYERGWMYSIEFPVEVEEHFFNATILQVLLHELVNRNSPDQQFDLPQWLTSGLISHLEATSLRSLALKPDAHMSRVQVKMDPAAKMRRDFEKELPLTFDELSWPETLAPDRAPLFRDSAHLFVHELLKLREGRDSLRRFIFELRNHRNWQFAFLQAFSKQFKQLVDVEKWWGLNFVNFMGRDASQLWSEEETWQQLKAALDVTMQVHLHTNRMPVTAEYNLQEAILQWDYTRQDLVLQKSLTRLRALRFRSHPDLRPLVDSYRKVIETYLEQRAKLGRSFNRHQPAMTSTHLKQATCRELDALDEERVALRQKWLSTSAAASP